MNRELRDRYPLGNHLHSNYQQF